MDWRQVPERDRPNSPGPEDGIKKKIAKIERPEDDPRWDKETGKIIPMTERFRARVDELRKKKPR